MNRRNIIQYSRDRIFFSNKNHEKWLMSFNSLHLVKILIYLILFNVLVKKNVESQVNPNSTLF